MSEIFTTLAGIATVSSMVLFFGIVWWACSPKRAALNEEAAHLPFALPDECTRSKDE